MSTAPIAFTGVSSYSNDLQSILARTLAIAQLPIKALQNQQAILLQQKQAFAGISSAVRDVGNSIAALGKLGASRALTATSSNTAEVTALATGATSAASYAITNITSVASAASETSATGYSSSTSSPVSANGSLSLVLGSNSYAIALGTGKNNLVGLRDAINASGAGVTATILTTGTGATPNYLSISANSSGQTTLQLNDIPTVGSPTNLLTSANQGNNAVFKLNGVSISRTTNAVNDVVPGVTFSILGKTGTNETVNISLGTDRSQISSALQDFTTKYNTLVGQVNQQIGPAGGLLSGDFLIRQIGGGLHQAASYQGSNSIKGLANLGISLDNTGKATFDPTVLTGLTDSQISDAFAFLGSSTTGFGALAQKFISLSDPVSGAIKVQEDGYDKSYTRLGKQIADATQRVSILQAAATSRLQKADALLATLQSQQTVVQASIGSANLVLYGYGAQNA